jgi:hypothetical protein
MLGWIAKHLATMIQAGRVPGFFLDTASMHDLER